MKRALLFVTLATVFASCNSTGTKTETVKSDTTAAITETPSTIPPPTLDSATQAQNMTTYMMPGDMQKMLESMSGSWITEATLYMPDEQKSTGSIEYTMIMGGRFQQMTYKGAMMGEAFEGLGLLGYDNLRKVFTNSWIDNMSTAVIYFEGPYDEATKTISMKGKCTDPSTGRLGEMRQTVKFIDDKNHLIEQFATPEGGKEMKTLEIKVMRK